MSATLTDSFGRRIEYIRLSVTDKCELHCCIYLPRRARGFANRKNQTRIDARDTERTR